MLSISLDWLSFTIKDYEHGRDLLRNFAPSETDVPITALYGYTIGSRRADGVVRFTNTIRPEMGVHIEFSGSALRTYRANGGDVVSLVIELFKARAKATRIDLAKDAQGEAIDTHAIADRAIKLDFYGSVRKPSEIRGADSGHTLYLGSYKSDRFGRLYDKAVEQGIEGDWKRYEIVCKGDYAKRLLRVLAQNPTDWDGVFNTMARGMFLVNVGGYEKFLQGGSEIGLPQLEKRPDREKWIESQVTKAIAEHFHEYPESPAIADLFRVLSALYAREAAIASMGLVKPETQSQEKG